MGLGFSQQLGNFCTKVGAEASNFNNKMVMGFLLE